MHRSIETPAIEARYRLWMMGTSTRAFILAKMRAGLPAAARAVCASIWAIRNRASSVGATASLRCWGLFENPDSELKSSETSSAMSGSAVSKPRSV